MQNEIQAPSKRYAVDRLVLRTVPQGLIFSEYILFGTFAIGLFLCISRPIFGITLANSFLKHVPLTLFLMAFALHFAGRAIFSEGRLNLTGLVKTLWPFLVLGGYATVGSLFAKYVLHVQETFLTFGIYLLAAPFFFVWGRASSDSKGITTLVKLWGAATLIAVVGALAHYGKDESLHEIEFLVLPFFLYLYFSARTITRRFAVLALLTAAAILTQKLTGYILGFGALAFIGIIHIHTSTTSRWRPFVYVFGSGLMLCFAALLVFAFFQLRNHLPTGNIEVRLHQYSSVFDEFLTSPIWGLKYTGSSGELFREGAFNLNIPTHSDLLDLIKQGGLIAFGLWLLGMSKMIKLFVKPETRDVQSKAYFLAITFMTIASVISYAFNPLLLKPPFALVIWGMLSFSVASASNKTEGSCSDV